MIACSLATRGTPCYARGSAPGICHAMGRAGRVRPNCLHYCHIQSGMHFHMHCGMDIPNAFSSNPWWTLVAIDNATGRLVCIHIHPIYIILYIYMHALLSHTILQYLAMYIVVHSSHRTPCKFVSPRLYRMTCQHGCTLACEDLASRGFGLAESKQGTMWSARDTSRQGRVAGHWWCGAVSSCSRSRAMHGVGLPASRRPAGMPMLSKAGRVPNSGHDSMQFSN